MNKQTVLLIVASFAATICFIAAGLLVNLGQSNGNTNSTAATTFKPSEASKPHPVSAELFNFGDTNSTRHQILLDLTNNSAQNYTLTTVSLDDPLLTQPIAMCTHTGVSVVAPPSGVTAHQVDAPSVWDRISAWLASPVSDSYFIALWSPNDNTDAYVLVSGDGATAPVVCSSPVDEGV